VAVGLRANGKSDVAFECLVDFAADPADLPSNGAPFGVGRARKFFLNGGNCLAGIGERFRGGGTIEIQSGLFGGGKRLWRKVNVRVGRFSGNTARGTKRIPRLIAGPEALSLLPVRRGKKRELLLEIRGMLSRGDSHRDFFAIPEDGNWNIFVGCQKK